MHIRLMLSTPVDFLNTYQFAWNVNKAATAGLTTKAKTESLLKQRRRVWKHLEQWMRTIPRRHGCLVVGDLNIPVVMEAPIAGPGVMEHKKAQQQDQEAFMEILRVSSCTVLNSWTGTGLQLRTFIPPGPEGHLQGSQIDYLTARGDLNNQTSRKAAPFEAPFVPTTGCRHLQYPCRHGYRCPRSVDHPHRMVAESRHTRFATASRSQTKQGSYSRGSTWQLRTRV